MMRMMLLVASMDERMDEHIVWASMPWMQVLTTDRSGFSPPACRCIMLLCCCLLFLCRCSCVHSFCWSNCQPFAFVMFTAAVYVVLPQRRTISIRQVNLAIYLVSIWDI